MTHEPRDRAPHGWHDIQAIIEKLGLTPAPLLLGHKPGKQEYLITPKVSSPRFLMDNI